MARGPWRVVSPGSTIAGCARRCAPARRACRAGTWRDLIDRWPRWRGIACPILLVRGADSDVLSPEIAKRMLEENPNTRYAEVAGAGHTVPGDQPAAFRALLTDFLSA